jgi:glycosyltransferase involved in cell wall biosynthesis
VAREIKISETVLGQDHGFDEPRRITLPFLRTADYRASVPDIAEHLLRLMRDPALRQRMGEAGRGRVSELFNYRKVAERFAGLITARLGIH